MSSSVEVLPVASAYGVEVAELQQAYSKLSSAAASGVAERIAEEQPRYEQFIDAVRGSDAVKQLAADYLPEFLHLYPSLGERGINALLDLCEDDKVLIRIHAIRGLEVLGKKDVKSVGRIVEVLVQLLATEDASELQAIKLTLSTLFTLDTRHSFVALMNQSHQTDDEQVRSQAWDMLADNIKKFKKEIKTGEELKQTIADGLKNVLSVPCVIGKQTLAFLLHTYINLAGEKRMKDENDPLRIEIGQFFSIQANLPKYPQFDPSNENQLLHLCSLLSLLNQFVDRYSIDNSPFIVYIITQIWPHLSAIAPDSRVRLAQSLAVCIRQVTPKIAAGLYDQFYNRIFKEYLPKPTAEEKSGSTAEEGKQGEVKHNIGVCECVVGVFHVLSSLAPAAVQHHVGFVQMTGQPGDFSGAADKKADFFDRITSLQHTIAAYRNQSKEEVKKSKAELQAAADADAKKPIRAKLNSLTAGSRQAASLAHLLHPFISAQSSGKNPSFFKEADIRYSFQPRDQQGNHAQTGAQKKGAQGRGQGQGQGVGEKRRGGAEQQQQQQGASKRKKQAQSQPAAQQASSKKKSAPASAKQGDVPSKKRKSMDGQFDGQPGSQIPPKKSKPSASSTGNRGNLNSRQGQGQGGNKPQQPRSASHKAASGGNSNRQRGRGKGRGGQRARQ